MRTTRVVRAACAVAASVLLATACDAGSGTGAGVPPAATSAVAGVPGATSSSRTATATPTPTPTTATQSPAATTDTGYPVPTPAHVVVVVFENKDVDQVTGTREAPFLNALAARGAAFLDAHGEAHPSQPNYLALFSGSTQGITNDSCPHTFTVPTLADQLYAVGRTFTGYSEGLPSVGFEGCSSGRYARKHNPWVNWPGLSPLVNQPLSALPSDFADLPTVSFLVPDLCNDMHDCPVHAGDAWAYQYLGPYVDWAESHNSLLFITFDEDAGTSENHIATIVAGAGVATGSRSNQRIDHYSLLRTIEDMYSLPPLGHAASAQALTGIWAPVAPARPSG